MKKMKLTNGDFALLDNHDYDKLSKYNWGLGPRKYIQRTKTENGKQTSVVIHREIMGCIKGDGKTVDHVNRNRLDNRRVNLRLVNRQQSATNCSMGKNNTSGYKGVSFLKSENIWQSRVMFNYKSHFLGNFKTAQEAGRAYDKKTLELNGVYAVLNFKQI